MNTKTVTALLREVAAHNVRNDPLHTDGEVIAALLRRGWVQLDDGGAVWCITDAGRDLLAFLEPEAPLGLTP